jgi:HSP20 family protein
MPPRDLISWKPSRTEQPGKAELPSQRDESYSFFSWLEPMERFFKSFFQDFRLEPSVGSGRDRSGWTPPRVALTEHDKELELIVEVPGLSEKDIEVKLTGDRLILGGSKENEPEDREHLGKERSYGSFYRSLALPPGIAMDDIRATIKDGVLTLKMPKTEEARRRQRKIEAGQG